MGSKNTLIYNNTPLSTVVAIGTASTNALSISINMTGITTSNINLIAIAVARNAGSLTITDSKSNGYSFLTAAGSVTAQIGYVLSPIVGATMSFIISALNFAAAVFIVQGPNPPIPAFDKQNNNAPGAGSATVSTGNITPAFNGDWLLAAAATGTGTVNGTPSTIAGWSNVYIPFRSAVAQGLCCYYQTQQYSQTVGVTFSHSAGTIEYFGASIGSWSN